MASSSDSSVPADFPLAQCWRGSRGKDYFSLYILFNASKCLKIFPKYLNTFTTSMASPLLRISLKSSSLWTPAAINLVFDIHLHTSLAPFWSYLINNVCCPLYAFSGCTHNSCNVSKEKLSFCHYCMSSCPLTHKLATAIVQCIYSEGMTALSPALSY